MSHDDGLNWDEGTVIDYSPWGGGCLVEVEPDVLLCMYTGANPAKRRLAQLIRVTPEGIKPIER